MPEKFVTYREGIERLAGLADVDEVLKSLSRLLKKSVNSLWAVVYLLDRERHDFAPGRSCGLPARYLPLFRELPLPADKMPLIKNVLRKQQHLLVLDAGSSGLLAPKLRSILDGVTLLAVPMVVRNQSIGVIFIARAGSHPPFSEQEIALLRLVVSHAALVVSHIRLFDESLEMAVDMARRIDVIFMLDDINKAISSSLSPAKIMETALGHLERIVQCAFAAVLVKEKGRLTVRAVHANGLTVPPALRAGARVTREGIAGAAFVGGESRYTFSLADARILGPADRSLRDAGLASVLAVPLAGKEAPKGVLLLGDTRPGQFSPEDAFTIEKVAAQMAVALDNARLYEETRELFINTVASLANAIDAKSSWTKGHSERVMRVAAAIAGELGLDEAAIERVRLGGLLHDIGKIGIVEALLEKPAILSEHEIPPMRLHPQKGVGILAPIKQLRDVLPGILHHHEWYDGTGYPDGLKGEEIPLEARIISVADSFDAIVSARPYKSGLSITLALAELVRCSGSQFDPMVVEGLTRHMEKKQKRGRVA